MQQILKQSIKNCTKCRPKRWEIFRTIRQWFCPVTGKNWSLIENWLPAKALQIDRLPEDTSCTLLKGTLIAFRLILHFISHLALRLKLSSRLENKVCEILRRVSKKKKIAIGRERFCLSLLGTQGETPPRSSIYLLEWLRCICACSRRRTLSSEEPSPQVAVK